MKSSSWNQLSYNFYLWFVSTAIFALYFLLSMSNKFSALLPMLDLTAPKPYVYRILTPLVIRGFTIVTTLPITIVSVLVMYLSMLGFAWSILALLRVFLPDQHAHPLALIASIGLIPMMIEQRHIYDLPTLFLFTLAYFCLARAEFNGYVWVFFLTTMSKETALFLILFFAIQFIKLERTRFFRLIMIQVMIYVVIRLTLMVWFKDNPGSVVESHWMDHLNTAVNHPTSILIPLSATVGLLWLGFHRTIPEAEFARNAILAVGAPLLILYIFFGKPFEVRVFFEVYPVIFLFFTQFLFFHYRKFRQRQSLAIE